MCGRGWAGVSWVGVRGWGCFSRCGRRCRGGSDGEGAVGAGDAEVGEAHEVDGCGSMGEPEVVGGDASVGDASGLPLVSQAMERSAMGRCRR